MDGTEVEFYRIGILIQLLMYTGRKAIFEITNEYDGRIELKKSGISFFP